MLKMLINGFAQLHEKGLIGDQDPVGLAYRFAGELVNVDEVLGRGRGALAGVEQGTERGASSLSLLSTHQHATMMSISNQEYMKVGEQWQHTKFARYRRYTKMVC